MPTEKNLGRKLAEARSSGGKIALRTTLRAILAGVIILAGINSNPPGAKPVDFLAGALVFLIILGSAAWVFAPLFHLGDYAAFYEGGIEYRKRRWSLDELGEISFMDMKSNHSLFRKTYMCTDVRRFDVTYIKDAKKNFNRAYMDTI